MWWPEEVSGCGMENNEEARLSGLTQTGQQTASQRVEFGPRWHHDFWFAEPQFVVLAVVDLVSVPLARQWRRKLTAHSSC